MVALDILIGLVTVYLVFGIACTAIVEALASWLDVRGSNMEAAMKELLAGKHGNGGVATDFVALFYRHPLIQSLSRGEGGKPSYIPPETAALVVESVLLQGSGAKSLQEAVAELPGDPRENRIKGLLDTLVQEARGDGAAFRKAIETQFNAVMDRASGWVKRRQQKVALMVATLLVILGNVDTVAIVQSLSDDAASRELLVFHAQAQLDKATELTERTREAAGDALDKAQESKRQAIAALERASVAMQEAGLEFGWNTMPASLGKWLAKIAGLLVSVFAVTLGAPFWFDVLQRFMRVRSSGPSPEEAGKRARSGIGRQPAR